MIKLPYLTTCISAQIIYPLFYNRPETGNIIFSDGSKLYHDNPKPSNNSNVIVTSDNKTIITSDNKQIQLNI